MDRTFIKRTGNGLNILWFHFRPVEQHIHDIVKSYLLVLPTVIYSVDNRGTTLGRGYRYT